MLRLAAFPPDRTEIMRWFAGHAEEWRAGSAHRFAVLREGGFIGLVDVASVSGAEGALGYWFDKAAWGRGYATEAAQALVAFAFDGLNLSTLRAAHASDNVASARVLQKLGFRPTGKLRVWSRARAEDIVEHRYLLTRTSM